MTALEQYPDRSHCGAALRIAFLIICSNLHHVDSTENKVTDNDRNRNDALFIRITRERTPHLTKPTHESLPVLPERWAGGGSAAGDVFRAFWNLPNSCGDKYGIDLPLAEFGIEFNSNHSWKNGDVVTIFGRGDLGCFPYYENASDEQIPFNGGLPQLGNITRHLEKATVDILNAIPNPDYDGIGIIDWESWRPQWDDNFDTLSIYREKSRDHVRAQHPSWDKATVEAVAELEWTMGAKLFMESTLKLAKGLRPHAVWGYYAYPYCFTQQDAPVMNCSEAGVKRNDDIMWLFNESSALYPSIYLRPSHPYQRAYVRARLGEAFRVRDRSSDPKGVILSYTRFNYSYTSYYFSLEDLNNTILLSAEMGTHGVVFWGDNLDEHSPESCSQLRSYINTALGPVVASTRKGASLCSARVCGGRGRCVGNVLTCGKARDGGGGRADPSRPKQQDGDFCSCRCFRGWTGSDCSIPSPV